MRLFACAAAWAALRAQCDSHLLAQAAAAELDP
jgi:hypothetical protein